MQAIINMAAGVFILGEETQLLARLARSIMDWYGINGVNRRDWTTQSPDLNPTENIWDELGHRIKESENRRKSLK